VLQLRIAGEAVVVSQDATLAMEHGHGAATPQRRQWSNRQSLRSNAVVGSVAWAGTSGLVRQQSWKRLADRGQVEDVVF